MKQKTCISWWEKKIRKRGIILAKQFASMESVIPPSFSELVWQCDCGCFSNNFSY